MFTKAEAIKELLEYGSHAAFDRKLSDEITAPFGFKAHLGKEKANVHPKGLLMDGVKPGTVFERISGCDLACQIADHLNLTYPSKMGRGFQFREAMGAIQTHMDSDGVIS